MRFSVGAIALLTLVGSAEARSPDAFHRVRFVKKISADPFRGVAGSEADTQAEPHVAVDPGDPAVVVAVFQQGRFVDGGAAGLGFSTSHDGGRSWITGNLPGLTVATGGFFQRGSDPVAAIGPDGAVYAQTLLLDGTLGVASRTAVAVQRSDDGGLMWHQPVLVQDDAGPTLFNDKNWIAVDTFPGSPHHGRIYSAWDRVDGATFTAPQLLRYSDDGGVTWSSLVVVSPPVPFFYSIGALPLVQPGGDLTIVYDLYFPPPSRIVSQTSHDGGSTFDSPVTIDTYSGRDVPGMRTGGDDVSGMPAAAVDPVTGKLYVAWQDARFRQDGQNDIVMSVSTDGAASWSPLVVASQPPPARRPNQFTPAVAAHGGAVLVAYASREDGDAKAFMHYVVSTDDGATFSRERRLGRASVLDFAAVAGSSSGGTALLFLGDYMGLMASASAAHAVWCRPSRPRRGFAATHHQTTWSAKILR